MQKIGHWIVHHRKTIFITYGLLLLISLLFSRGVVINYRLSDYLPSHMDSKKGIDVLSEQFGNYADAQLILKDVSLAETLDYKQKIQKIKGVKQVVWLDDVTDPMIPLEQQNQQLVKNYRVNQLSLLQIIFTQTDTSPITRQAMASIETLIGNQGTLTGHAIETREMEKSTNDSIQLGMIIAVAVVIIILILTTESYFEVILFLLTIGIAVLLNHGTNFFFPNVSYITNSSSSLLQLAIAMDYSIFLLHRFTEERRQTNDPAKAMVKAIQASAKTIASSALTTIAGFIALTFMSFLIGSDMGFVLAKGILISLISVLTLLPCLALIFYRQIDKTIHRPFIPSFRNLAVLLEKGRFMVVSVLILIAVPAYLGQSHNHYIFGTESISANQQIANANELIEKHFGRQNPVVIIIPRQEPAKEKRVIQSLSSLPTVNSITGYYSLVDITYPDFMVPTTIKKQFLSTDYSRYILNFSTKTESDLAFTTLNQVKLLLSENYDDYYITGQTSSIADMKAVSTNDYFIVSTVSIAAVGIILLITFKSLLLPFLLMLIIQVSIWINMSIPYFSGNGLIYLGFLIVIALQLGATIDYAILLTSRYLEARKTFLPKEAGVEAMVAAAHSIFTSSIILGAAGLTIGVMFKQPTLQIMGTLVGRGALLSGFLVITVLPALLTVFDTAIIHTSLGLKKSVRLKNKH